MFNRSSGILMHISTLFGNYGIGTFGDSAKKFVDFLSDAGFHIWQILPLSPVDEYGSPYTSISAFAGNLLFISPENLFNESLIDRQTLESCASDTPYGVNLDKLFKTRMAMLKKAFCKTNLDTLDGYAKFCSKNSYWLDEYAEFTALREANNRLPWWKQDKKCFDKKDVDFCKFTQFLFDKQWKELKAYANKNGVSIIGDIPFYISRDSADFKANTELFLTDSNGNPTDVAGVPPDYFSKVGQLWGNPLYDWDKMRKLKYDWWFKRLKRAFELYDIVRIDHFRGFSAFYSIPASAGDAMKGNWNKGPGTDFFDEISKQFGKDVSSRIIAEDLGITDRDSKELLKAAGFYGMRVFQFGFSGENGNPHLPENYVKNCVAYTSTHDNNTLLGWIWALDDATRASVLKYLNFRGDWGRGGKESTICKSIINSVWKSDADIAIVPIQDLLGFGCDTRMNTPGIASGNWQFRITENNLREIDRNYLHELNNSSKRFNIY